MGSNICTCLRALASMNPPADTAAQCKQRAALVAPNRTMQLTFTGEGPSVPSASTEPPHAGAEASAQRVPARTQTGAHSSGYLPDSQPHGWTGRNSQPRSLPGGRAHQGRVMADTKHNCWKALQHTAGAL
jgi:hypothetical protein